MERPLEGEPLALDLLNSQWMSSGQVRDALDEPGWMASWLAARGLPDGGPDTEAALRQVRAALRSVVESPGEESERALNEVLARGSRRWVIRDGQPQETVDVPTAWAAAWQAAVNYLELVDGRPERVRHCANPACILWFYDTSRNGGRRWCSMERCGNRLKAARHYQRTQAGH